jgi:hypothetical protein
MLFHERIWIAQPNWHPHSFLKQQHRASTVLPDCYTKAL